MNRALFAVIFLTSVQTCLYASTNAQLQSLFENEQYELLRKEVRRIPERRLTLPDNLFFLAFTCNDPDSALPIYRKIVARFPQSKYADQALFRLGQYSFFAGDYADARRHFSKLLHGYSNSYLKDDAQYLYCQSVLAQGKTDSAKIYLTAFVQNVRRSPYVDSAILDLESLGGVEAAPTPGPSLPENKVYYSIRVASFKSFESAKNAMFKLAKIYPHVEVGERRLGNTDYYLVYLGRFDSLEKAQHYAKLYIRPHLQDYKIVERRL